MEEIVRQTILQMQEQRTPQVVPLLELHRQIWTMARASLNSLYEKGVLKEHRLLNDRGVQIVSDPQD